MLQPKLPNDVLSSYYDFVPQAPISLLQEPRLRLQRVQLLEFVLREIIHALNTFFVECDYSKFDPHVGDTLCQIRAVQIASIAYKPDFEMSSWLAYLEKVLHKVKQLLSVIERSITLKRTAEMRRKEDNQTLEAFFTEHDINFAIPSQIDYIAKAYLLTKYKFHPLGQSPKIDYKKLRQVAKISKDLAVRIIRYWQKSLAFHSCEYIKSIDTNLADLMEVAQQSDDDNRSVLPCFLVMCQLLHDCKKHYVPIQLVVRNPLDNSIKPFMLCFRAENGQFKPVSDVDANSPCFTAHGVSHALAKSDEQARHLLGQQILHYGIEKILLASVANHPQFNGIKLSPYNAGNFYKRLVNKFKEGSRQLSYILDMSSKYEAHLQFALEKGCDYQRPKFVFIEHMFAATQISQDHAFGEVEHYLAKEVVYNNRINKVVMENSNIQEVCHA